MRAIVVVDKVWGIGKGNDLLFSLPADMKHFRETTAGKVVVMGSNTLLSFPGGKPLKNRTNIVLWPGGAREDCTVVHSLQEAIALFPENEELFIIGGGQIYAEALPLAKRIYLTEVNADYEGDTYFPQWDRSEWDLIEEETFLRGEKFDQPFAFLTYEKR